ncbi:MAG: DegV family protein [Clostridia bacterium]|nr:DegV family protein [Clostridia bacterium]
MRRVKIITDSCSDLYPALIEKYDIDYAKMSTVHDGTQHPALLEWSEDDVHRFYNIMRNGGRITTAQVSVEEFRRIFKKYLDAGYDIIYIGCSLKQSGSVNTASVVADKMMREYPEAKIFCIDSQNASIGEGMLAIEAAKMAKEAISSVDIANRIVQMRKNVNQFATVHSLDSLKKAGRVTASSAFFGNLMGVKPILISDAEGAQAAIKKIKGRDASLREIVFMLKAAIKDEKDTSVYIAHADCALDEVQKVVDFVKAEIKCADICVGYIGPIIGASVGPDAIGVWAFGEKVTFCASK